MHASTLLGLALVAAGASAQHDTPAQTIMTATWPAHAALYGKSALCSSDEITLWSCEAGERSYAFCSSRVVTRSSGYMQYRSAEPGTALRVLPEQRVPPLGLFTYVAVANGNAAVDFESGGYRYSLVDSLRGESSLFITAPGESGTTSETRCEGGNQTLQVNYTMKLMYDSGIWSGK